MLLPLLLSTTLAERFRTKLVFNLVHHSDMVVKSEKDKLGWRIVQDLFDETAKTNTKTTSTKTYSYRIINNKFVTKLPFPFKERHGISELFDKCQVEF